MYQYEYPFKIWESRISCDFCVWLENGGILTFAYWFSIQHFTETQHSLYIIPLEHCVEFFVVRG